MIFYKNLREVQKRLNIHESEMPLHCGIRYDWVVFKKNDQRLGFCCGHATYKDCKHSRYHEIHPFYSADSSVEYQYHSMLINLIKKYGDRI